MRIRTACIGFAGAAILAAAATAPAAAERIIRDAAQIASMPIQGVTLSMTPKEAFEELAARGYTSQGVPTYEAWTTGGISMVWGTYGGPEGFSEIVISRTRDNSRIISLSETFNRTGRQFDTAAEISAMQSHFGIGADEPDCRMGPSGRGGTCRVAEAEENTNHVYGLTAMPTMIQRYATRQHELQDSY